MLKITGAHRCAGRSRGSSLKQDRLRIVRESRAGQIFMPPTRHTPKAPPGFPAIVCTHLSVHTSCKKRIELIPWSVIDSRSRRWRWNLGWGDLVTAASKKGGGALHEALVERPGCRIRRLAGGRAQEIRFTRLLRNPSVSAQEMALHAAQGTAARVRGRDILVVQDTSELALGAKRARANGYGPIGKGGGLGGLLLHAALAIDRGTGALLGLTHADVWNREGGERVSPKRKRLIADKESQRWLDVSARASEMLTAAKSITVVSDRDSDIYDYFAKRPSNVNLIVRACQNRKIVADAEGALLFSFIDGLAEKGRFVANIPAAPGRKERVATLAVRFSTVELRRPQHVTRALPETIAVAFVDVREVSTPADAEPIHWRLLTTLKATKLSEARQIIDCYRMRWNIEEFFRTLKTAGFNIEQADISDPRSHDQLRGCGNGRRGYNYAACESPRRRDSSTAD